MAVYVYSIASKDHPMHLDDLHGVGEPPGSLHTVDTGALCAVVSDAPDDLRPRRRDVLPHQQVQERLMADGVVLPLRFGLTAEDEDAVRGVLEDRAGEYQQRLQSLAGCASVRTRRRWWR